MNYYPEGRKIGNNGVKQWKEKKKKGKRKKVHILVVGVIFELLGDMLYPPLV